MSRAFPAYLALAALALGGACIWVQGPLPGDIATTRALQALLGSRPGWAVFLTGTAKLPLLWGSLGLASILALARGGWRIAVIPAAALVGAELLDTLLRAYVFAPRPTPELVAVAAASPTSGLPSTFALVYGALFAPTLFAPTPRPETLWAPIASAACIALGACARIALAGHWPSQILASLLLAFALVGVLVRVVMRRS